MIFFPRQWDKQLKRTIAPGLLVAMLEGVKSETALKFYAHLRKRARAKWGEEILSKMTGATALVHDLEHDYGVDLSDIATELPEWFLAAAANRLDETFQKPYWQAVNDATRNQLQTMLTVGIENGLSIRELSKAIGEIAPDRAGYRAVNCARTETGNMMNAGHALGIQQTGEETGLPMAKEWLSVLGPTTRDTHTEADGQSVPVDEFFTVGGEQARWPGDENLSAGERCNCQCTIVSDFVADELDEDVTQKPDEYDDEGDAFTPNVDADIEAEQTPLPDLFVEPQNVVQDVPPPIPQPEPPPPAKPQPGRLPDLAELRQVQNSHLGGSTGAQLMQDADGNLFVVKRGSSPEHLREEYAAEQAYRALKVPIPDSKLVDDNGQPVKISRFVQGTPLSDLPEKEQKAAIKELRKHFAADALLANWDVAGMSLDNVIVDKEGTAYRIDVGGALRFRAQGGAKGGAFGSNPLEIWTLRDASKNPSGAKVFGDMGFKEVVSSAKKAVKNSGKLIKELKSLDPQLAETVQLRAESLKRMVDSATTLNDDKFKWDYADNFTRHEMQQDAHGLFKALPDKLEPRERLDDPYVLFDKNGKAFDDLRGQNGMGAKLRDYFKANDLPYGTFENFASEQSGDSWSKGGIAMKDFVMRQRGGKGEYWEGGRGNMAKTAKLYNQELAMNLGVSDLAKLDDARTAQHAFFTNMMRTIDMPGNNRQEGYIEAVRTETPEVLAAYGLKPGMVGKMKRGAAESFSQLTEVVVHGDQLTVQQIPHHRVFAHYGLSIGGNSDTMLFGDRENEIVADAEGLDVGYIGEAQYGKKIDRSHFDLLKKKPAKDEGKTGEE